MFLLDSLMISGLRWTLQTVLTAAEAEMNDDAALRDRLLEAEMRREMGEIDEEAFAALERDLLARIREIRDRRQGGSGPVAFGMADTPEAPGRIAVEASIGGDFHEPPAADAPAPHSEAPQHSPNPVPAPARRPSKARTVRRR